MDKPTCPTCGKPIDRLQPSRGVVAAYPCNCWLPPTTAVDTARAWRTRHP